MRVKTVEILLVEDSPDDAALMINALREGRLVNRVSHVEDGEEALAYLRREGPYAKVPRPDLILLDLVLPRKSGHEVLAEREQDPALRPIPVVVLTGSADERAITESYDRQANCCVRKPGDLEEFALAVKKIEHFWLYVARRPNGH
jgi:CheY-like chemotaxis protein